MSQNILRADNHSRDSSGMRYVYPVISRRAGGVSVGINLNPNNACNWRCVYCQVPDLQRGGPPPIDLVMLEEELKVLLGDILEGDFLASRVPEGARQLMDVAFSGNGEPTSAAEFPAAVQLAIDALARHGSAGRVPLRLITNGSLLDRRAVRDGIAMLGRSGGEVWFKFDAGTADAIARINGTRTRPEAAVRRLSTCARIARTWVQTCVFAMDGETPAASETEAYLVALKPLVPVLAGVHLYGLARPSMQKEAPRLGRLDLDWMNALAERIRRLGLIVNVSP